MFNAYSKNEKKFRGGVVVKKVLSYIMKLNKILLNDKT